MGQYPYIAESDIESSNHSDRLEQQLLKLKRRHQDMMLETAAELEVLERQLEVSRRDGGSSGELKREIAELREMMHQKEQEMLDLKKSTEIQQAQLAEFFDSVKQLVKNQALILDNQIQKFTSDVATGFDQLVTTLDKTPPPGIIPIVENQPATINVQNNPIQQTQNQQRFEERAIQKQEEPFFGKSPKSLKLSKQKSAKRKGLLGIIKWRKSKKDLPLIVENQHPLPLVVNEKEILPTETKEVNELPVVKEKAQNKIATTKKTNKLVRLSKKLAVWAILGVGGWQGYNWMLNGNDQQGTVAGVSTTSSTTAASANSTSNPSLMPKYEESMVDLPYSQTVWDKSDDPEFGISMEWPKNTSNRIRVIGGDNIWYKRKDSYLMRISRIRVKKDLDTWWAENKKDYQEGYTYSKGSFRNNPAIVGTPVVHNNISGIQYFMQKNEVIYQIWIKEESPESDDGQRLAHMTESMQFQLLSER